MLVIDCRLPVLPQVPGVAASRDGVKVTSSNRQAAARHYLPGARREVNDLDYLIPADRDFIRAVTGELTWPGQDPVQRPVSAFALRIAVDRRIGLLADGERISAAYLRRSVRRLVDDGRPNPFTPELLEKAFVVLGAFPAGAPGRVDLVC